ncbi:MAG: hypothetical protein WD184_03210 [Acidimicrobiia bacterium]
MAISLPSALKRVLGATAIAGAIVGGTLGLVGFGSTVDDDRPTVGAPTD